MKTTKSLVWACLAVMALTFTSTVFAGDNNTRLVVVESQVRPNIVVEVLIGILRTLGF